MLIRLALLFSILLIAGSVIMFLLTRDVRYSRFARQVARFIVYVLLIFAALYVVERFGLAANLSRRYLDLDLTLRTLVCFCGAHSLPFKASAAGHAAKPGRDGFAGKPYAVKMSVKTGEEQRQTAVPCFLPTKVTVARWSVQIVADFVIW